MNVLRAGLAFGLAMTSVAIPYPQNPEDPCPTIDTASADEVFHLWEEFPQSGAFLGGHCSGLPDGPNHGWLTDLVQMYMPGGDPGIGVRTLRTSAVDVRGNPFNSWMQLGMWRYWRHLRPPGRRVRCLQRTAWRWERRIACLCE